MPPINPYLFIGGMLSFMAAFLHILCIIGGPNYLRFFGAGEGFARFAETGSWIPGVETLIIGIVLIIWGVYAVTGAATPNGAGVPLALPFLKWILVAITAVYLVRGLVFVPVLLLVGGNISPFAIWSSAICLGLGIVHVIGMYQIWGRL
ncbi:MAG: hypothetical protein COA43_12130 [Robiginitomaculum sp.]|nr:MAG: hypothetical protein COA43_12130 [Robiginitomaculum sp.]